MLNKLPQKKSTYSAHNRNRQLCSLSTETQLIYLTHSNVCVCVCRSSWFAALSIKRDLGRIFCTESTVIAAAIDFRMIHSELTQEDKKRSCWQQTSTPETTNNAKLPLKLLYYSRLKRQCRVKQSSGKKCKSTNAATMSGVPFYFLVLALTL